MIISITVAMGSNHAIGIDNRMPWHLSADLQNFRKITMGKPILMGRKTFESIGRPLPGRENIVITRNPDFRPAGCSVFHSIEAALLECQAEELMVIGGASFYQAMLPVAERIYLTRIHREFDADTFFPEFDLSAWQEVHRRDISDDASVEFDYSFIVLEKNRSLLVERLLQGLTRRIARSSRRRNCSRSEVTR